MLSREYRGVALAVVLFVLVQLGALALVPTFFEQGYQPVEDPQDPTNSLIYFGAILVATALMLAAFKYELDQLVRLLIVGVSAVLSWYVFTALFPGGVAAILAVGVAVALLVYPEWYVIDTAGVLIGAGAAGLFGISFGILPALLLLLALAVYDAISVYGTKHMLDLAAGVMDLRIPVVLVLPTTRSFSLFEDGYGDAAGIEDSDGDGEIAGDMEPDGEVESDRKADDEVGPDAEAPEGPREAFFIGLGDAVIPAILVASAAFFSPADTFGLPIIALNAPALGAMIGTIAGLLVLMHWVMKGRPHAGLPLLNGGAIGGYLIGSLLAGVSLIETLGLSGFF